MDSIYQKDEEKTLIPFLQLRHQRCHGKCTAQQNPNYTICHLYLTKKKGYFVFGTDNDVVIQYQILVVNHREFFVDCILSIVVVSEVVDFWW